MSAPSTPAQRFVLGAPPPVRPLAIGAVVVLLGAVLLVASSAAGWPTAVAVLAVVLVVLGLGLSVTALVLTARLRTTVELEPAGVRVRRAGTTRTVAWEQVDRVTLEHPRLTLVGRGAEAPDLVVVNPRGVGDPVLVALVHQLRARLDRDRGYTDRPG